MSQPLRDNTYSPGLEGVIASETAISTIETGLSYRGYSIEDLAEHSNYEEVAYLILHGELPTAEQAAAFRIRQGAAATIPAEVVGTLRSIPHTAPSMDVLRSAVSLLAHWDADTAAGTHAANLRKAERLLAQVPVVVAARHRLRLGQEPLAADAALALPANFLWMLRGKPPSATEARALDASLMLYAEHELNASTFTARCVVSSLSDLHSGITAAIGALKGPLHGGANAAVLSVLEEVGSPDNADSWVRRCLAEKRRIMGFGHRVYKEGDPRAVYLKKLNAALAAETGNGRMEQMADTIERVVRTETKLLPNVDWPCARLYHYLGLPRDLYTPLFVVARVAGWSAHIIEQLDHNRLISPRGAYRGPAPRRWQPIGER